MARKRRRRRLPVIGTAPGQKGRLIIEPSELIVERQPDRVIVHDQRGTQTRTLGGSERHIHINAQAAPGPAPRPERQLFDFNVMREQLEERFRKRMEKDGINLAGIKKPEFISRWRGREGKGGIIRNLADLKKVDAKSWLIIHPLMLLDAMVTSKGAIGGRGDIGRRGFRRATRQYNRALELRKKYAPMVKQLYTRLEAQAKAALEELMAAAESSKVNWENRNFFMQKYEKVVKQAEHNFVAARTRLLDDYAAEWKKSA